MLFKEINAKLVISTMLILSIECEKFDGLWIRGIKKHQNRHNTSTLFKYFPQIKKSQLISLAVNSYLQEKELMQTITLIGKDKKEKTYAMRPQIRKVTVRDELELLKLL